MKLKINDINLNYVKNGSGAPLLLLHGNGEDHHIFDKLTEQLKKDYTVYSIDSRNHGESSQTDDYSYQTMMEDIAAFIKQLDLKKVHVIGFSDGGVIGLLLAMKYPELLGKMAVLGANLQPTDMKKGPYQYLEKEYAKTKDPLIKLMLEEPRIDLADLKNIKSPTFVIGAANDIIYRKTFQQMARAISNSSLKIIEGHDHGSYIIDEDLLYPDLMTFFKQ